MWTKLRGGFLVGLGYLLSPLSWWNDLIFNLPIAAVFGYAVSWYEPTWFLPATAVGYWASNVLGILMMQWGATDLLWSEQERNPQRELLMGLGTSTAYTLLILGLVYFHILETPELFASR